MNSIETSAPVSGITLSDAGHGSHYAWRAYQEARRRYPGASRYSIEYRGSRPKITPHYTRAATPATRRAGSGGSQQDRFAARLAELEQTILRDQLREIEKTL